GDLCFAGRDFCVGMFAEKDLAQFFTRQKAGLRAFEFYFFELLTTFAFEFSFWKRSFAREFVHQTEERFREFAEAGERNRAGVLPGAGRKIGTEPAQIFLDLAAGALCSSGANHGRSHVRKPWSKLRNGSISATEVKAAVESRNRMRLDEDNFEAVCQRGF